MRARRQQHDDWGASDAEVYQGYEAAYDEGDYAEPADYDAAADEGYGDDEEHGLILRKDESLVGVSSTVTHHGAPILSYTRTMNRFYTSRKQRLSLGRHRCEVCGDRIRFWSFQTPTGTHTHDGCYERLAWMWTNLYAQQQRLASEGLLE